MQETCTKKYGKRQITGSRRAHRISDAHVARHVLLENYIKSYYRKKSHIIKKKKRSLIMNVWLNVLDITKY